MTLFNTAPVHRCDEAGFGRINKPKYCWCERGTRPSVPCHHIREYRYAYRFDKARKKYEAEHDYELTLFKAARKNLKEFSPGKQWTDATVAEWQKELTKLKAKVAEESPKVKIARDEMLKLRGIQNTLERYLKPRREIEHELER